MPSLFLKTTEVDEEKGNEKEVDLGSFMDGGDGGAEVEKDEAPRVNNQVGGCSRDLCISPDS